MVIHIIGIHIVSCIITTIHDVLTCDNKKMDFVYDINNNILYYVTIITFIYDIILTDYDIIKS